MMLKYPRSDMVLGLKGHRINKCIFHTNDYYIYVNTHLTDKSNTAWV